MKRILMTIPFVLAALVACQPGVPPTQIVMEVTRQVTVVVTSEPINESESGPIAIPTATPGTPTAQGPRGATAQTTPTISPTPNLFPEPERGEIFVAEQEFENGRMFWVRPIEQIWVIYEDEDGNPVWERYEDNFEDGMIELDPDLEAPSDDLQQPIRGFGKLWRENPDIQEALGWALQEEVGYNATYEYHYGGSVEDDEYQPGPGYHIVVNPERITYRFNEGIWEWEMEQAVEPTSTP